MEGAESHGAEKQPLAQPAQVADNPTLKGLTQDELAAAVSINGGQRRTIYKSITAMTEDELAASKARAVDNLYELEVLVGDVEYKETDLVPSIRYPHIWEDTHVPLSEAIIEMQYRDDASHLEDVQHRLNVHIDGSLLAIRDFESRNIKPFEQLTSNLNAICSFPFTGSDYDYKRGLNIPDHSEIYTEDGDVFAENFQERYLFRVFVPFVLDVDDVFDSDNDRSLSIDEEHFERFLSDVMGAEDYQKIIDRCTKPIGNLVAERLGWNS
jgi:hypothetical protein